VSRLGSAGGAETSTQISALAGICTVRLSIGSQKQKSEDTGMGIFWGGFPGSNPPEKNPFVIKAYKGIKTS